MNKAELVEALARHYDGSRSEAAKALDAVVQTITRSTVAGERVAITGFGVFERVERPARMVRNPRTGERKEAAATAVPRFRAGTELKAYVAGQRELPDLAPSTAGTSAARNRTRRPAAAARPSAVQEPLVDPAAGAESPDKVVTGGQGSSKKSTSPKADARKADTKKAAGKKAGDEEGRRHEG